ncbi:HAD-like domain-containing protein [Phakopsora pachyrhizi]|nr:HAD-like domain-containing protein [Phakopsora pachyrhizi]
MSLEMEFPKTVFRDSCQEMIDSISAKHPFEECKQIVQSKIKLDPVFKDSLAYVKSAKIPVVIVSSGMVPIICAIFENLVGKEDAEQIEIVANEMITFRHPESGFGQDKDQCISPNQDLSPKLVIFFCGDGVSDLLAANLADCRLVKVKGGSGNYLTKHCEVEEIRLMLKDVVKSVDVGSFSRMVARRGCKQKVNRESRPGRLLSRLGSIRFSSRREFVSDLEESDIDDIEDWDGFDEFEEDIIISGSERGEDDHQERDDDGTPLIFKDQLLDSSLKIRESFSVMRDEEFYQS